MANLEGRSGRASFLEEMEANGLGRWATQGYQVMWTSNPTVLCQKKVVSLMSGGSSMMLCLWNCTTEP